LTPDIVPSRDQREVILQALVAHDGALLFAGSDASAAQGQSSFGQDSFQQPQHQIIPPKVRASYKAQVKSVLASVMMVKSALENVEDIDDAPTRAAFIAYQVSLDFMYIILFF
jgi:hypothetical protein